MANHKRKSFAGQMKLLMETQPDFPQRFKQRLVFESGKVANPVKFILGLISRGVLCDGSNDSESNFGLKEMMVQLGEMLACSKDAEGVGGLIKALGESGNLVLISTLRIWAEEEFGIDNDSDLSEPKEVDSVVQTAETEILVKQPKIVASLSSKRNHPVAVKSLANQEFKQESKAVKSTFFEQPVPLDGLQKVATFNCQSELSTEDRFVLEFDKEELRMRFPDCAMKVWSLQKNEEKIIKFGVQVKNITCSQFDDEILVLGTSGGTLHLFDLKTLEEKFSMRFSNPVHSLKFVESTLVILTEGADRKDFCWVDICRPDMRLLNRRLVSYFVSSRYTCGFYMDPEYSFLHTYNQIQVLATKTGSRVSGSSQFYCWLEPPAIISTLNVLSFISAKRNVVAGCENGLIATWSKFSTSRQPPRKILKRHTEAVVGLCTVNGHLLSLDQGGKLLMWSGYDLESEDRMPLVARDLSDNFFNVTSLVAHERWFASCSSEDGIINIWTLPDLWLRTG